MKAGQYITYKSDWNIAHCYIVHTFHTMIDTVRWESRCQLLLSSSSFSSDSGNIDWLTFQISTFTCDSPISSFSNFWLNSFEEKKDTDFIRNFCCHKKSLLDYHQTPPLHPQLQHFWCSVHLRKLFPNYQNSFLPSARSGGVSEFMQVPFFLLLFHGPSRDSGVLMKSFLVTGELDSGDPAHLCSVWQRQLSLTNCHSESAVLWLKWKFDYNQLSTLNCTEWLSSL